jgi:hypothetical protein
MNLDLSEYCLLEVEMLRRLELEVEDHDSTEQPPETRESGQVTKEEKKSEEKEVEVQNWEPVTIHPPLNVSGHFILRDLSNFIDWGPYKPKHRSSAYLDRLEVKPEEEENDEEIKEYDDDSHIHSNSKLMQNNRENNALHPSCHHHTLLLAMSPDIDYGFVNLSAPLERKHYFDEEAEREWIPLSNQPVQCMSSSCYYHLRRNLSSFASWDNDLVQHLPYREIAEAKQEEDLSVH